ncbi:MAG: transposase family protein [Myxococcales bacterium]|nr:transposase family protein [Myxococcales bacterium]
MTEKGRRMFSNQLKATVALEAIRGVRTANELVKSPTPDLSVFAAWTKRGKAQSSVGHGVHVYSAGTGFVYLVAILDLYSRKVLAWRISNTLDSAFCVACPDEALQTYGKPEIFNTDQGCQFTSEVFTSVLKANGILISMDGRGRALDNTTWSVSGTASNTRIPT